MTERWPHNINPNSIVDLRPKPSRMRFAGRELTAVRFVLFLIRLAWRAIAVIRVGFYRSFF